MTSSRGAGKFLNPLNTPYSKDLNTTLGIKGIYTPNLNKKIIQEVYKSKDKVHYVNIISWAVAKPGL